MSSSLTRSVLTSILFAITGLGSALAQTISVNNAACPGATVTYGAGTIAINTAGCGTTATAPSFSSGTPPGGNVGTPYSYTFTASGSPAPTISLVSGGSLPNGLNLSASGVLSGTPSVAGTYTFAVQAVNSGGTAVTPASGTHSVVITNVPVITSATPTSTATPGNLYQWQFNANQTITQWTASPTPPSWVLLNPTTGLLAGTPLVSDAGTSSTFTVSAATASNGTATQSVTINVIAPTAPTISGTPSGGTVGTSYSYGFTVTGSPSPTVSVVSGGTLPTGLTLSPTTGVLSGTPTVAGTYTFAVQAANTVATVVSPTSGTHSVVIGTPAAGGTMVSFPEGIPIPDPSKEPGVAPPLHVGTLNGAGTRMNAWPVDPARCNSPTTSPATSPAITHLWQHNINFDSYSYSASTDIIEMPPKEAFSFHFVPNLPGAGNVVVLATTVAPQGYSFMSISTKPCDFDYTQIASGNSCYRTRMNNTMYWEVTNGTPASSLSCKLVPGQTYYFNLRWQNANTPATGGVATDSCTSAKCAVLVQIGR